MQDNAPTIPPETLIPFVASVPPVAPKLPSSPETQMNDADQSVNSLSLSFEEALYANYLRDPDSVSPDWRQYFDELSRGDKAKSGGNRSEGNGSKSNGANGNGHKLQLGPQFRPSSFFARPPQATAQTITPAAPVVAPTTPNGCTIAQVPAAAVDSFAPVPSAPTDDLAVLQDRVDQLIRAYRVRGHMVANVDPLGRPRPQLPELDPRPITSPKPTWIGRFRPTRSKVRR